MKKFWTGFFVMLVGVVAILALTVPPANAAKSARTSYSVPAQNTVQATITSMKDKDQLCDVSFYGPRAYTTPRTSFAPHSTKTLKVTGLPAGRYSVYLNCGALQVDKQYVTVGGRSTGTPQTTVVANPRSPSLSSAFGLFGSS